MNWKNLQINIQNIEYDTGKSTLIKMPHNSNYDGYVFWHPSKLIRSGNNSYSTSLGYTDGFTFKLKKYGKGKHNFKDIIDEQEISAEEFEEAMGVMEDCSRAPSSSDESYLIVEEPQKVEKEVKIVEELKNERND